MTDTSTCLTNHFFYDTLSYKMVKSHDLAGYSQVSLLPIHSLIVLFKKFLIMSKNSFCCQIRVLNNWNLGLFCNTEITISANMVLQFCVFTALSKINGPIMPWYVILLQTATPSELSSCVTTKCGFSSDQKIKLWRLMSTLSINWASFVQRMHFATLDWSNKWPKNSS